MKDEEIKSNLDGPLYGRIVSPLCKLCIYFDGFDKDWYKKKAMRCKKYGDTPKEYFDAYWHKCPYFKPNEWYERMHKDVPYDPDTWEETVNNEIEFDKEWESLSTKEQCTRRYNGTNRGR